MHLALHLYNLSLPYPSLLPYQLSRLYGGHKSEVMQDRPILIFVTMSLMLKSKTLLCRSCEELPGKRGERGKEEAERRRRALRRGKEEEGVEEADR